MTALNPLFLVAGGDLGRASAKLIVARAQPGGVLELLSSEVVEHQGRAAEAFLDWYRRREVWSCAALGLTGLYAEEVAPPALSGLPEDACREAALPFLGAPAGPLNLVSVGARGYAVLSRDGRGRFRTEESEKCSSGTGETMVRIARRFGLTLAEADLAAARAASAIPITARCSVFAKSELTHFANQGRPADALLKGYFSCLAGYVAALLERVRVEGPVWLLGGVSRVESFASALGEALGQEVRVPEQALLVEAIGAAALAADQLRHEQPAPLPESPEGLVRPRVRRFRSLPPASGSANKVVRLPPPPTNGAVKGPLVLGLDLGSTGSKAALVSAESGDLVWEVWDRTRGNPVEAAKRLLSRLGESFEPDVRAVGVTGSGREAVATVLRAAVPGLLDRLVVVNEIVAHATAAVRLDPDHGESLSIVEIGGQDAKYVRLAAGRIVESDMNKACSAGTGSFIEEQAALYGIEDLEELERLAALATRPPDLGQMCTVFVAESAAEALSLGYSLPDVFSGLQHSVVHNYLGRVMGQRTFARRIFFQGKPAQSASLAWTLAAVTGREVYVPPNPGAMGAYGIALCAREELGVQRLPSSYRLDLRPLAGARIAARSDFQCRDRRCATFCRIEKTEVDVGEARSMVLSGGACPKFELSSASRPKLSAEAPSAFDERAESLREALRPSTEASGPTVGLPLVGALVGVAPLLAELVRGLGGRVQLLEADPKSLSKGEALAGCYDACAPVKLAHGVLAGAEAELVFFPRLLGLPDRDGDGGVTCAMEQALPESTAASLAAEGGRAEVLRPAVDLRRPKEAVAAALLPLAVRLGAGQWKLARAIEGAFAAQRRYDAALAAIGERTLEHARTHGLPVVLVCGSLHVLHDATLSAGVPRLLRDSGALAVPMDAFPIPPETEPLEKVSWADARRALRAAVAARARGDVYPLWLSSFGCGPSSFAEAVFDGLLEGHPHTILESDAHGGTAGYVTRIQSFLHAVRGHDRRGSQPPAHRLRPLDPGRQTTLAEERKSRLLFLSFSDRAASFLAASYRSFGFEVETPPPTSPEVLAASRRDCSGKECLPYQLVWGAFRTHLEAHPPRGRTVLMQAGGSGLCRNCMFSLKDRLSLERMGLSELVEPRSFRTGEGADIRLPLKIWMGIVAWGLLQQLTAYHRTSEPAEVDRLYRALCDQLEKLLARPEASGLAGVRGTLALGGAVEQLLGRAAEQFAALSSRNPEPPTRRTVLLGGDIYVRLDEFASDGLARRLAGLGLRVVLEPLSLLAEYAAEEKIEDLFGLPTGFLSNWYYGATMREVRRRLYERVRALHPWLPMPDAREILKSARGVIDRYPRGEAPVTIGSALHHFAERACDGVVLASPWGCGPALVAESLLRHRSELPLLVLYADGTPIDERRLRSFAFRLRRSPPRSIQTAARTASPAYS
ncbi:MAG: hypothetical protein HYZ28_28685 [Myxococcales bacterium]|nr:hypothetical protein [Myxococcales bacterium]